MNIYFTSDTHFGHVRIIELSKRPFKDVDHMNEVLIQNWNSVVKPEDTIVHIGDFGMGPKIKHPEYMARLNGRKILIRGNHDQSPEKMLALGFAEVYLKLYMEIDGFKVYLSHIPIGNDRPETPDRYYPPEFVVAPDQPYDYWLCGHVHNTWARVGNVINVGVDVRGFKPVSFQELITAAYLQEGA